MSRPIFIVDEVIFGCSEASKLSYNVVFLNTLVSAMLIVRRGEGIF